MIRAGDFIKMWSNCVQRRRRPCLFLVVGCLAIILPLILAMTVFAGSSESKLKDTGIIAFVIFRHGQRTPFSTYPNDPYKNDSYWPDGWGFLTNEGKMNAYNFGKWLRERYAQFLPELYSPNDIYVQSTFTDRTIMSAQLCLAGLYPPKKHQIWNSDLLWQPIPVYATPRNFDQLMLIPKKMCPKYDQEYEAVLRDFGSNSTELYKYLSSHTGYNVSNDVDVETLYNILELEDKAGYDLPSWTKSVYPTEMRNVAVRGQRLFTKTTNMRRLKGGPIIKDIISHMKLKIENQPEKKLYLYSGHDMTLLAVMEALGVDYYYKPDPLDALLLELHKTSDSQNYLEISYLNHTQVQILRIYPKEDITLTPISLDNFIQLTKPIVPINWEEECKS